jgi:N-acetylmuramoyl-L-alanine amidase
MWIVVLAGLVSATVLGCSPTQASPHRQKHEPPRGQTGYEPASGVPVDPEEFAHGACVSFAPTAGDNHRTVFIDAGHGGIDPGARGVTETGQTIYEADETLPVELDTMALLRAQGYRVVVSRVGATNVARLTAADLAHGSLSAAGVHADVAARDICANLARATILLGIYFNAWTSPANAGSLTGYDAARPFAADNLRLATLVQHDVLASMNEHGWRIPDDGVVSDTTLGGPALTAAAARYGHLLLLGPADPPWFTTPSQMPGALIEPLFITDPFEGTIAGSTTGQQAIAHGMAEAVEQYFAPEDLRSRPLSQPRRPPSRARPPESP